MSKLVFASVISEIQQSDVFMTVKARICEAPEANLNGARVTEAFIDEIVGNEKRYVGLPLYADVKALTNGNYNRLGHLYDVRTGEFHSTQIGSFYKFEKQKNGENCYLVGYARIPKRNKKLSRAISELFADGALKFSFELSVGEYEELDDETILIDASENNYLEGTAIVTYPACEDAVALELVAQKADETRKGESEMAEVENKAEVVETEATQPELAEEEKVEAEVETEEKVEAETVEEPEDETAACKEKKKAEDETAEVVTHEYHEERHTSVAYDTETGKEVSQTVTIETVSNNVQEGTLVETVDGVHVAEEVVAEDDGAGNDAGDDSDDSSESDPIPEETNQDSYDSNKKTAEQMIAELLETVNSLKAEIEQLKEQKETKSVTAEINPFMGDINSKNKYSLLESDNAKTQYTLL
ncbi:MAG: hypothetical protein J6Y78_16260 [Paludibacteraceae bacterium]|nr:hypothetical protein [Paludibacteraceae bacterium]